MATITSGSFAKALWPGVNSWYGRAYDEHQEQCVALFDKYTSGKQYEEDVGITSFGLAAVKPEGGTIPYDSERQGFVTRYSHVEYALGFIISRIAVEDDQYKELAMRRSRALAFSMRQTKENVAANVYNRAFNGSYTGGDGLEMCSDAHINVAGGTWANELAVAADFSEAALEQACIDIRKYTNDRGLKINVMPNKLILPVDLEFEAERTLKSPYRVGTSDNDLNAINSLGKFPGGIHINNYLTDQDAWFIRTNAPDGMKYFERRGDSFATDNDFDTDNAKYKAQARYSYGWTDPRGIFGSPGA